MGSSPALDQIFFVQVFFRLCEIFFANFFNVSKGSTLHFFSILHKNGCSKPPKGPPFTIFRHYATYRRPKNFEKKFKKIRNFLSFPHAGTVEENTSHFEVLLLFLSLRYGADLGRSRLVFNFRTQSCFNLQILRCTNSEDSHSYCCEN